MLTRLEVWNSAMTKMDQKWAANSEMIMTICWPFFCPFSSFESSMPQIHIFNLPVHPSLWRRCRVHLRLGNCHCSKTGFFSFDALHLFRVPSIFFLPRVRNTAINHETCDLLRYNSHNFGESRFGETRRKNNRKSDVRKSRGHVDNCCNRNRSTRER